MGKDTGGRLFPYQLTRPDGQIYEMEYGATVRDLFVAAAIAGYNANPETYKLRCDIKVWRAGKDADALLGERREEQ